MAGKTLKLMCVHGLGDHRASDWEQTWAEAITEAFPKVEGVTLEFSFVTYDDIFEKTDISLMDTIVAMGKLAASGLSSIVRRERGIVSDVSNAVRWSAGYVVAWVEDESFQRESRKRILAALREHKPDVVLAHSLGSLVTYNAFAHAEAQEKAVKALLSKVTYVTLGSQIANPFVVGNLTNGRIQPLGVDFWHHLYNFHDDVFTAPIRLPAVDNFSQTETPFDDDNIADHAAESYFRHRSTIMNVWRPLAAAQVGAAPFGPGSRLRASTLRKAAEPRKPVKKALLIGINEYPDPAQRLEGCVNDVFMMSSVLQDCGVPPEAIRTCLNERATAEGILSRLAWLLDRPGPGDELIFYYSGHGARVPEYGENFEPDHHVETLVPWDFDWTPERYISDDQIFDLYSQLPYECRLVMIFDCCHSGDMHRQGGMRPRGIVPPDDIRHRELKWDNKTQMWVSRDFERINGGFTPHKELAARYFGGDGTTERIGRAPMLRRAMSASKYDRLKKQEGGEPLGPYLPVIIEACAEQEYSYEYRHGATSYGAFTYSLASILRREKTITFENLVKQTGERLAELRYDQRPQILGPTAVLQYKVPWVAG